MFPSRSTSCTFEDEHWASCFAEAKLQRPWPGNTKPRLNIGVLNGIGAAVYGSKAPGSPTLKGNSFLHVTNTGSIQICDKTGQAFSVPLVSEGVKKHLETNSRIIQEQLQLKTLLMWKLHLLTPQGLCSDFSPLLLTGFVLTTLLLSYVITDSSVQSNVKETVKQSKHQPVRFPWWRQMVPTDLKCSEL